jgi:NADPH-dependent curcumin reductase CurA
VTIKNTAWYLQARPTGEVGPEHFDVRTEEVPDPGPGQVLVRNIYLMIPASMRIWMNERDSYLPAVPLGTIMRGITTGVVEKSDDERLPVGTYVNGMLGWQEYAVAAVEELMPLTHKHPDIRLSNYRHVLDVQGLTAYIGVVDICEPVAGQTMVVTAAAGSVGSLACQIGKKLGLRVIGIAGGPEKCQFLLDTCGVDGAIDYKSDDVGARLDELCPDGIDMIFENVGGPVLDLLLDRTNLNARIALCGLVSTYFGGEQTAGRGLMNLINKRATMRGFLVLDHLDRYVEVIGTLTPWVLDGSLVHQEEILEGLDNAPVAMNRLSRGENHGMQLIRISPEN